mmetsp:Transcript_58319/g.103614  ORF Transcript_58319/g.103614 Transcript_58319/m.103614 type:complete len:695 (+) Transcript_58319:92-2176(+)
MEDAAAAVAAPKEAAILASFGVLGGLSNIVMTQAAGMAAAPLSAGVAVGAASAAVGALAAKAWCERYDYHAVEARLAEVKRHAPQASTVCVEPLDAIRQLLESLDWCLAVEEQQLPAHNPSSFALSCVLGRRQGMPTRAASEKDFRRQLRKVRGLCTQLPSRGASRKSRGGRISKDGSGSVAGLSVPGSNEAYERLFNPQWGSVRSKQGVCGALAYLVGSFLELRQNPQGNLHDGPRASLRLAVAALSRHPAFEDEEVESGGPSPTKLLRPDGDGLDLEEEEERSRWNTQPKQEQEFRSAAMALLCILDAALCWCPTDPIGWSGICEDPEGASLVREKNRCSFPYLAGRLRRCLKKASSGCLTAWKRLEVHLDAVQARELPEPWPWVWVLNEEASMLVRNRTKVPLRVELHRPRGASPSPWADLPLLKWLQSNYHKPLLVADVGPGIEWALRPKCKEGREFKVRLLTKSGVVVCSRNLRRGQTFDFEVPVPPAPAQLRAAIDRGPGKSAMELDSSKAVDFAMDEDKEGSVCSTATPSLASTAPSSSLASVSSSRSRDGAGLGLRLSQCHGIAEGHGEAGSWQWQDDGWADDGEGWCNGKEDPYVASLLKVEGFRSGICTRCLHKMPLRRTRPSAAVYKGGVSCDSCGVQILGEAAKKESELDMQDSFCHCNRCWYDLCRACAWREMREVWWGDE